METKIIEDIKQIQINQYHAMADLPPPNAVFNSLLFEKRSNQFIDTNDKTDLRKQNNPRPPCPQVNRNGAISDKNPSHHSTLSIEQAPSFPNMEQDIQLLRHQIDNLQGYDVPQTKLRYEAELFLQKKKRNNFFRSYNRVEEQKQGRSIILENFINRKKPVNKNSLKIKKFLSRFMTKGFEQPKLNMFLQFISSKHKIPLQIHSKPPKLQVGYKESDVRKVHKYQVNTLALPPLGIAFDGEKREQNLEEIQVKSIVNTADLMKEEEDCFDERPIAQGYILPENTIHNFFSQNKREIFKISRNMVRLHLQKQSSLKRLAYHCVKEVQHRYIKCMRNQNDYINRAKKLQRQCLVYWRKRDKQLIQLKKKKEKLEAQLKKRDEEELQAKKQERKLQYIMYQSGLYSHFIAKKLGMQGEQVENPNAAVQKDMSIDEEAARLGVEQMIAKKMDNMQKFDKNKEQRLDFSSVDHFTVQVIDTPSNFHGTLKEYQLKGLNWLSNLFQQGINGILADEMGLGKTIQAIALLAHISQRKGIWGPFLVVAPNSTLYNWQQEFKKFCPSLKVLPYWGNIKQRKTIRKFFSLKKFTQKSDAPFHVVITSYQLTVADEKTFKRLKWKFMILDQAQAIKNILSQRWNTLKEFQTRNRLLLTGTPIQNNMAQLWALLNFVMPDLFDSHALFNQWFSKDIQAHSQDQKELDHIKMQRLHAILKPFMLRRVKKDVQHEIGKKYEHQLLCQMTKRQKLLYDSIKEKLNIKELFKMFESKAKVENLMNLVMQLRKVCNHPELFERRPARSPFCFQEQYYYTGYIPIKSGDIKLLSQNLKNPIYFSYPSLVYDDLVRYNQSRESRCKRLLNISSVQNQKQNKSFSCLWLTSLSMSEIEFCFRQDLFLTYILLLHWWQRSNYSATFSTHQKLNVNKQFTQEIDYRFKLNIENQVRSLELVYMPAATAPVIQPTISRCSYYKNNQLLQRNKFQKFIMEGRYSNRFGQFKELQNWKGVISNCSSLTKIQVIDFSSLIGDSSKLRQLDRILKEKKRNGDKVLIFCQMTKMIDILQDFMNLRKYTFFRLDGASNIADRRDMVNDFQKPNSKIFIFLLSTRAGGLGVTLTAANTVIFYDNDWNPTMDAQATDRAHRIGQSRDVNVYQLVTKGTIQERIVKRAQQKKTVQSTVYQGASFNFFKKENIIELINDEFKPQQEIDEKAQRGRREGQGRKKGGKKGRQQREQKGKEQPSRLFDPDQWAEDMNKIDFGLNLDF